MSIWNYCVLQALDATTQKPAAGQQNVPANFATRSGSNAVFRICSHPNETIIGGNVILVCYYSKTDWLPINYTLFRSQTKAVGYATTYKTEERAVFNLTVMSTSDLGEYKCKAQRFNKSRYSLGLNITLRVAEEKKNKNLVAYIVPPLLLLLLLLAVSAAIALLILPWCKARKQSTGSKPTVVVSAHRPSSDNGDVYDTVYEENEYCNVKLKTKKEDNRNVILGGDSTVHYAEVVIRR
ncbi:allergin-1 [Lacerta agilis]|uniref:allergin-1 n=1 Tax=Lacerta agilis TaxID=80427 RepID=UPI001419BBF8|nr:allergin-1 [Lacerta agilis]